MLILTDTDKKLISNMHPNAHHYCAYPENTPEEEVKRFMFTGDEKGRPEKKRTAADNAAGLILGYIGAVEASGGTRYERKPIREYVEEAIREHNENSLQIKYDLLLIEHTDLMGRHIGTLTQWLCYMFDQKNGGKKPASTRPRDSKGRFIKADG
jgi:hypothetical protein